MQSTRQEILSILREEKQATVEDLAKQLELTPMTIRHHLNVLQAQNLVEASKVRRSKRVGRPRLVYTLTDEADDLFPQGYGRLASQLVSEVKETVGGEETEAMFRRIAERVASEAPPTEDGQSFEERLDQVSDFLEDQGFLSRWEERDEGYVLTNVNCPYRRVSRQHREVCLLDTELIRRLLGVEPQRLSSQRAGEAACAFMLQPPEDWSPPE
ncbi:MAG: helix-turn-helix transcriptional regulator [Anaerolineae bacterium]|jgi:predicted ArsR family transcriptional regulator